jgi:hypothetical protein
MPSNPSSANQYLKTWEVFAVLRHSAQPLPVADGGLAVPLTQSANFVHDQ